jgi:hypothetical protein
MMTGDALGPEVSPNARDVPVVVKPLELRTLRAALYPLLGRDVPEKERNSGPVTGIAQRENA